MFIGFRHTACSGRKKKTTQISINNIKKKHPFLVKVHWWVNSKNLAFLSTALAVEIKDVKTGRVQTFNCNIKAAKYLDVSKWTIHSYKNVKTL